MMRPVLRHTQTHTHTHTLRVKEPQGRQSRALVLPGLALQGLLFPRIPADAEQNRRQSELPTPIPQWAPGVGTVG